MERTKFGILTTLEENNVEGSRKDNQTNIEEAIPKDMMKEKFVLCDITNKGVSFSKMQAVCVGTNGKSQQSKGKGIQINEKGSGLSEGVGSLYRISGPSSRGEKGSLMDLMANFEVATLEGLKSVPTTLNVNHTVLAFLRHGGMRKRAKSHGPQKMLDLPRVKSLKVQGSKVKFKATYNKATKAVLVDKAIQALNSTFSLEDAKGLIHSDLNLQFCLFRG